MLQIFLLSLPLRLEPSSWNDEGTERQMYEVPAEKEEAKQRIKSEGEKWMKDVKRRWRMAPKESL